MLEATIVGSLDIDNMSKCSRLKRLYLPKASFRSRLASPLAVLSSPVAFTALEEFSLSYNEGLFYGDSRTQIALFRLCKDSEQLRVVHLLMYKSSLDSYTNYFSQFKTDRLEYLNMPNAHFSESESCSLAETIATKWSNSLVYVNLSNSNITVQGLQVMIDGFVRKSAECPLKKINLSSTCVTTELITYDMKTFIKWPN